MGVFERGRSVTSPETDHIPGAAWLPRALIKELVAATGGSYDVAVIESVNTTLENWLASIGWEVSRIAVDDRADLLVAELHIGASPAHGPVVTLLGHSDTVWPSGSVDDWNLN